jgi:hypothetical protein
MEIITHDFLSVSSELSLEAAIFFPIQFHCLYTLMYFNRNVEMVLKEV